MMQVALLLLQLSAVAFAQNITIQSITAFALVYGYPLLAWQRYASGVIEDVGVNTFRHARELSTPANRTVVKPNVDTLYSTLIYDLSDTNLAISVPAVPADNFKLFSFYDPYGVNWANVGTGGFYRNGTYLLRADIGGAEGLEVTNGSTYLAELHAPSPYGSLLIRWGVNDMNEDLVHQYQDSTSVRRVPHSDDVFSLEVEPSLASLISKYNSTATPAENVLDLVAAYSDVDSQDTKLSMALQVVGISDGTYEPQPSVNLTEANTTALATVSDAATNPDNLVTLNQGWFVLSPDLIGVYGDDDAGYALRAAIAASGYLALRNPFAVYPTWSNGSNESATHSFNIGADEAIMFTFSGKPPLQQAGFWSLTAYGGDYFLIPNDIETYALGDRSNITYPGGSPVYGPDADEDEDGMFQILMQPADVAPPSNWTSNWLPAPSGGGAIVPQLRFFAAEDAESNGEYEYPTVTRMAAVKEGGNGGGNNGTSGGGGTGTSSSPSGTSSDGSGSASASFSTSANSAVSVAHQSSRGSVYLLAIVGSLFI